MLCRASTADSIPMTWPSTARARSCVRCELTSSASRPFNRRYSLEVHPRACTLHSRSLARCASRSFVFADVCVLTPASAAAGLSHEMPAFAVSSELHRLTSANGSFALRRR